MAGIEMRFDPDNPGIVKFADVEANVTAAPGFECQVTSVTLTPSAVTDTLPATLCQGESDTVKSSKWNLDLEVLQDWTDPDGVSFYLYDNDAERAFFSVSHSGATAPIATGEVTIQSGAFLGAASGALTATVSLPCVGKPVISKPTGALAATADTGEGNGNQQAEQPAETAPQFQAPPQPQPA